MPVYLAPGVYVEEVSFRSKSIEGVGTTTTGFIGPTRFGPITMEPDVLTSLADFERTYGDGQQLNFSDIGLTDNYLWHAARAFFEEGGSALYVVRTFRPAGGTGGDGVARATVPHGAAPASAIQVAARFPGAAGNVHVRFTVRRGLNVLGGDTTNRSVGSLQNGDIVWIGHRTSPPSSPPGGGTLYRAEYYFNATTQAWSWRFHDANNRTLELTDLTPSADPALSDQIRIVTLTVTVFPADPTALPEVWDGLPLDPGHQRAGQPDSFTATLGPTPTNRALERTLPIVITLGSNIGSGLAILDALNTASISTASPPPPNLLAALGRDGSSDDDRSVDVMLTGGNDGQRPGATEYEGTAHDDQPYKTGLKAFEDIDQISIVAAPGSTFLYEDGYRDNATTILNLLIAHAEHMRYRIAVLDSGDGQSIAQVRAMRGQLDSKYAAFYYPWIRILDPITRRETVLPPSGFVAGIYARNDVNRAVYKAPANEVVTLAVGFEQMLNKSQQEVLNPEGINCFRFFEGRGYRLWGARTISSDPEWKYVNLRRYFAYLEHSIDKGTQWAVFEPNGEALWANVRRTIEDFLLNEWQSGALLGDKPEKAYFVRCDRSTMTQNDLDNGRMVCLVGVAPLRPAEFVIFRIGQWTADSKG